MEKQPVLRQKIDVYYGKRIISLTDKKHENSVICLNRNALKKNVTNFINGSEPKIYIYSKDLNELFLNFKSLFKYVEAAGGLVINSNHQILVIQADGVWQLPKGHVEENELHSDAAIREVEEETGIKKPEIIEELPSTFHIYKEKNKWILKRTYWFKMLYKNNQKPIPQTKERITKAIWIDYKDLWIIYDKTYDNLKIIFDLA